ncbi:MAG: 7TM diverse intracellular signaling domain-containing protein [Cyclobacteriaceae bacterium]
MSIWGQSVNGIFSISHLEDVHKTLSLDQAIDHTDFEEVEDIGHLNFGLSESNHWIKVTLMDSTIGATYMLSINTVGPDSIFIYQRDGARFRETLIGEPVYDGHQFPTHYFTVTENPALLYLKIIGQGHPIALPLNIDSVSATDPQQHFGLLITGLIYGLIVLIMFLALVLFYSTSEKLYLCFALLNFFSILVIAYYDGFIRLYLFTHSTYWNNQSIAIAFCSSFIAINYYMAEFLMLRTHVPQLSKWFVWINLYILVILGISFWHPTGFRIYIIGNVLATSIEVIFFLVALWSVRKSQRDYLAIQLTAILLIVTIGTVAQLYFLGYLPVNAFTLYAVHMMIIPQIIIQSYALGKRFAILTKERSDLLKESEKYSQSLITTLENERKRLSGEFHDSIGQNLLVIRNRILMILKGNLASIESQRLTGLADITSETLDEIRTICQDLRPSALDTIGLSASLDHMVERLNKAGSIDIKFECHQQLDDMVGKDMEINVYRILQELMNNILKHSKAKAASIKIYGNSGYLIIEVEDNGVGFNPKLTNNVNTGNGLSGIKERVKLLNAQMAVRTQKGRGVSTQIKIPRT